MHAQPCGPRTNLRAQLTSFVGREDDVARVPKALEQYRLVTLVGPGGTGKTRLAAEVAAVIAAGAAGADLGRRRRRLRRGLAGRARLGHRPGRRAAVRAQLDRPERASALLDGAQRAGSRDARTRLLGGLADARALLVLDNCEHLIDACAHLADELLRHCPGLRIVATSREPLGITGESLLSIAPLSQPAPGVSAPGGGRLPCRPAVRRARGGGQPRFRGHRRDGRPRHRHRPPPGRAAAGDRTGRRQAQDAAAGRDRAAAERPLPAAHRGQPHRPAPAPHAARGRGVELGPAHAGGAAAGRALRRLPGRGDARRGRGGLRRSGRARDRGDPATVDPADIDDLLSSLVDKSLLQPVRAARGQVARSTGGTRLRMLETVREYGSEQLAGRGELGGAAPPPRRALLRPDGRGGAASC